jgi:hypothetical protein
MEHPTYHEGMRELQNLRDTRALADRLEKVTMRAALTGEDKAFIQRCRTLRSQNAAGRRIRLRAAAAVHAASAGMENLRRLQGCAATPRPPSRERLDDVLEI